MKIILSILSAATLPALLAAAPAITVYNQNFAVVRENLQLDLQVGVNPVEFSEITSQLEPSSVVLRDLSGERSIRILEQNYRADPLSQDMLLAYFEGQTIPFEVRLGDEIQIVRGRVIRAPFTHQQSSSRNNPRSYQVHQGNQPIVGWMDIYASVCPAFLCFPSSEMTAF